VTGGTIRQVVLLNVSLRYPGLAGMRVLRSRPIHLINLAKRPQFAFGMPVTGKTPTHGHIRRFPGDRHLVHLPVTGRAADTLVDMDGVVEVNIARHFVDHVPPDGLIFCVALPNRCEHWCVLPDLRVAGHARLCIRHARIGGRGYGGVAKAAVDPKLAGVVLMTEGHRLVQRHADIGPIGRSIEQIERIRSAHQEHADAQEDNLGVEIDAGWEELSHGSERCIAERRLRLTYSDLKVFPFPSSRIRPVEGELDRFS
jgi:hypothetical protein